MLPDERAFRADVDGAAFRCGVADRRWRLDRIEWPYALIGVTARNGGEFALRFNCAGFPASPPTAGLWDLATNMALVTSRWPQSRGGRVASVFRPEWKQGTALYLPCDRESIAGHDNWRSEMPAKIWRPESGIVHYLELVHELLNCRDFSPPNCSAT